ncbi:transcription factor S [Methanocaldococcus sp.]
MVKFCPKCNNVMIPAGDVLRCAVCGYEEKGEKEGYEYKEEFKKKEKIAIIEGSKIETLPTIKIECPKCGHTEAYWWLQQTRCADEPETRFYKCKKCGYTWREYD